MCEQANALHTVEVVVAINARANNRVEARMNRVEATNYRAQTHSKLFGFCASHMARSF